MEEGFSHGSVPIILGRPFMKIARTKIDVYAGTLSMEFGDIVVHFNILDAMKHPSEDHSIFRAEIIDQVVDDYMFDFDFVLHGRKHPFLSDLHTYHSLCTDSTPSF